ncbi:alpha/beta fold hydrolase [Embleya sp. NPDC008237]|uniref:alpha/beta fold hydrolase n=1 Tax=Embleya sp. NPDC008237 TaxID=3363978 RepID=UPI0036E32783
MPPHHTGTPEAAQTSWIRRASRSADARGDAALVSYWLERFDGADLDLELPTDRPRPATPSYAAARISRPLDPDLSDRLRSYAGDRRASLFMVVPAGLQVVLHRYTGRTDVTVLSPVAKTENVDCTELVPAVLRALLDHTRSSGSDLSFVRLLIGGGEKWHVREYKLAQRLVGPNNRVVNSYGVTEATVDNVLFEGSVEHLADDAPLPIGRPFPNNRVYVLDAHRRPVPAGVVGELYPGGLGVASGYHDRPELTAERFVCDPFVTAPGARMYRTGDSARFHLDGTVDFLGRLDDQVEINGYRIELGEVEARLAVLERVAACAVAAHGSPGGISRLIGYVVTRDGADADEAAYREMLAAGLPAHMVPTRILTLPALPLTPNGKLDRRALPAPAGTGPASATTPARTDAEKRIAAIWAEVLGIPEPGIDDNFFALGGDSFSALGVVRRIEPAPRLVEFYQYATIRRLAAHLDARSEAGPADQRLLQRLTAGDADPATGGHTVVAVPYSGGSAVAYQPLADALPANWALRALELPGHDRSRPDEDPEPIAVVSDRIVAEMRTIAGPVLLYGHCLGVALTVEVARRAEAAGVPPAGVALGAGFPTARLPGRFFDWIHRHVPVDRFTSDRESWPTSAHAAVSPIWTTTSRRRSYSATSGTTPATPRSTSPPRTGRPTPH